MDISNLINGIECCWSVSYSIQQRPNFFCHLIGNDFNKLFTTFYRTFQSFQNSSLGNMHIFRNIYRHFTQSPNAQIADITLTYLFKLQRFAKFQRCCELRRKTIFDLTSIIFTITNEWSWFCCILWLNCVIDLNFLMCQTKITHLILVITIFLRLKKQMSLKSFLCVFTRKKAIVLETWS